MFTVLADLQIFHNCIFSTLHFVHNFIVVGQLGLETNPAGIGVKF